jgi:hypothetical protein
VGGVVRVTIDTVLGSGPVGIQSYRLSGTEPFLVGETYAAKRSARITYELQAVQAGTAELSVGMTYETEGDEAGTAERSSEALRKSRKASPLPADPGRYASVA